PLNPAPMTPNRRDRFGSVLAPDADPLELILSASSSACRHPCHQACLQPWQSCGTDHPGGSPSTSPHMWRMPSDNPRHVLSQKITLIRHSRECRKWSKKLGSNPKRPVQLR